MIYVTRGARVFVNVSDEIEMGYVENVNRDGTIRVRFVREDVLVDVEPEAICYTEDAS